jgi:hypothetical protein
VLWIPLAILGWAGVIWLGATLYATDPRTAGFDLELLLAAGRRVAAGLSPYDASLVAGTSPAAPSLFYSYPPPVAQATSLIAGVPSSVSLVVVDVVAVLGLLVVTEGLRRALAPDRDRVGVLLPVIAVAPFIFPFAIGLLFGNADVFFPLLYGTMLLGALAGTRRGGAAAGVALALAALKLHPASLGLWFLGRGFTERAAGRSPTAWMAVAVAATVGVAILAVSVVAGGIGPWSDYVGVVRSGSGADIVDARNAGPTAILVAALGGASDAARVVQIPVALAALAVSFAVAVRDRDIVESFGVAAVASLVTLPVTWYHYPAALLPVAIASLLRARDARARTTTMVLATAAVVAAVAILWLPLLWVAIVLVVVGARTSRPDPAGEPLGTLEPAMGHG